MAVYPEVRWRQEVEKLKQTWLDFADANILQIQKAAREMADAPAPSHITKEQLLRPPEDDVVHALCAAIHGLSQSEIEYQRPPLANVRAEWVRGGGGGGGTEDGPVIFYVHGGGFIYGSVATARRQTNKLASLSNGRCFAVQYRYATEQPFPGTLLDVLVAYLYLLAPPRTRNDLAVPPSRIVFAGESAGLNILLSLIQVILYLRKQSRTIRFYGKEVSLELPSGIAGMSGFLDLTCNLPSWNSNAQWDCLQEIQACYTHGWKDQELWPSEPARADVYCDRLAMTHPLVSPITAMSWEGCPPLFIACGEERNADANFYVAQLAARQGVPVYLQHYEHMCHVWAMVMPKLPHSDHVLKIWATQCQRMSEGKFTDRKMEHVSFHTLQAIEGDVTNCTQLRREDILSLMVQSQQARPLLRRIDRSAKL